MDGNQTSCCIVSDKRSQSKYLCYTHRKPGLFNICLTDAADVWSTEFTEDTLTQFRQKFAVKSGVEYILKLRSACGTGNVSIVVQDSSAELCLGSGPGDLSVSLSRLEGPQAREELRELLFRMAEGLTLCDSKGGSPSASPLKGQQWRPTEFEPRRQQRSGPSVTVKKRLPGDSLINPGTKK
ncbi:protein PAXX isoform X2 [Myripristis murdjan]|nr:protein PAXX isoform X2 [Myripristis murdjan]